MRKSRASLCLPSEQPALPVIGANRVPSCGRTSELSPFVFAVGAISGYSCRPRRVVYAQDRPSQGRAIAPTRSTITGHAFI